MILESEAGATGLLTTWCQEAQSIVSATVFLVKQVRKKAGGRADFVQLPLNEKGGRELAASSWLPFSQRQKVRCCDSAARFWITDSQSLVTILVQWLVIFHLLRFSDSFWYLSTYTLVLLL